MGANGTKRVTRPTLAGTRIYEENAWFKYFAPESIPDPRTGVLKRWHKLCLVSEGETQARVMLDKLLNRVKPMDAPGDFPIYFRQWRKYMQQRRDLKSPKDADLKKMYEKTGRNYRGVYDQIEKGFSNFNLTDIQPMDVYAFLEFWEGQRSAQTNRAHLSKFFKWANKKGLRQDNPATADVIELEAPPNRDVYITDEQFHKVRDALLIGKNGKPTRSGPMMQCYIDLTYLLFQRTTEVRFLKREQIDEEKELMYFQPIKTKNSTGAKVNVPIGPAIREVLNRLKSIGKMRSLKYVIHNQHGAQYGASGLRSAWERACVRAEVSGITTKDIRAKAGTDAKTLGYSMEQIQTHMVHSEIATTEGYMKGKGIPTSEILMTLPPRKTAK
jgi:integrase